jgi:flagellar biosynthesis/type III secretory pathway protein FliH
MFAADESVSIDVVREHAKRELSPTAEATTMTIADQLRQEGHKEGLKEGLKEGQSTILRRLLERRFGNLSPEHGKRLEAADSDTLLEWSDRVLSVQSLDEVFNP